MFRIVIGRARGVRARTEELPKDGMCVTTCRKVFVNRYHLEYQPLTSRRLAPILVEHRTRMSNILLYSGPGVSTTALAHTKRALQELCPSYDVRPTSALELALAPWQGTASLVVIPGGRDLPYVDEFSKPRTREDGSQVCAQDVVRDWVENGGSFIGICAGGYFASSRCTFEDGTDMQVVGERPGLQFFPGECRGTVYKGFVYESDAGARVVRLKMPAQQAQQQPHRLAMHYNGGGAFINARGYESQGVTVLAKWPSDDAALSSVDDYAGEAAIVHCKVGHGQAVLFGTHPEFSLLPGSRPVVLTAAPESLAPTAAGHDGDTEMNGGGDDNAAAVAEAHRQELIEEDSQRRLYLGRCLQSLGLQVRMPRDLSADASASELASASEPASSADLASAGKLSPLILAGPSDLLNDTLRALSGKNGDSGNVTSPAGPSEHFIFSLQDTNDVLHFYHGNASSSDEVSALCEEATSSSSEVVEGEVAAAAPDLQAAPKYVLTYPLDPDNAAAAASRHWDMTQFYKEASKARERLQGSLSSLNASKLGQLVQYGERVTSTQTMLDKNPNLLTGLPNGFLSLATHQISGRGRGGNSWISPLGCLQFSLLLHISSNPPTALGTSPMQIGPKLVFVQYLAGLAIVTAIREGLGKEYEAVGRRVRLKWPNDIYAQVSSDKGGQRKGVFEHLGKKWAKMGGILVNSQYMSGKWSLVVGCGINCLNPLPTVSLSALIDEYNAENASSLPHISQEQLAGAVLATFERLWYEFLQVGTWSTFAERYRQVWLHSDQSALLTTVDPPVPIRIVGITSDSGMLRAVPDDGSSSGGGGVTSEDPQAWGSTISGRGWAWDLQPDGNSFDMLQGLIKTKAAV